MAKNNPLLRGSPVDLYLRWGLVYGFDSLFKLRGSVGLLIQWKSSAKAKEALRSVPADATLPDIYMVPRGSLGRPPTASETETHCKASREVKPST